MFRCDEYRSFHEIISTKINRLFCFASSVLSQLLWVLTMSTNYEESWMTKKLKLLESLLESYIQSWYEDIMTCMRWEHITQISAFNYWRLMQPLSVESSFPNRLCHHQSLSGTHHGLAHPFFLVRIVFLRWTLHPNLSLWCGHRVESHLCSELRLQHQNGCSIWNSIMKNIQ